MTKLLKAFSYQILHSKNKIYSNEEDQCQINHVIIQSGVAV